MKTDHDDVNDNSDNNTWDTVTNRKDMQHLVLPKLADHLRSLRFLSSATQEHWRSTTSDQLVKPIYIWIHVWQGKQFPRNILTFKLF